MRVTNDREECPVRAGRHPHIWEAADHGQSCSYCGAPRVSRWETIDNDDEREEPMKDSPTARLTDLVAQLTDVLNDMQKMSEVQNALIIQTGKAVMELQIAAGNMTGAAELADRFRMAAEVLKVKP